MRLILLAPIALAGCMSVPDDQEGAVYAFNGDTVTIRGGWPAEGYARPNTAMVAQAKDVCPSASYLSASPSPTDDYTFLYLFRC